MLLGAVLLAGCNSAPRPTPVSALSTARNAPVAPIVPSTDPWVLSTEDPSGAYRGTYLGNGVLGQRLMEGGGALVDTGAREPAILAGNYAPDSSSLRSLPPLLPLSLTVNGQVLGGQSLRPSKYRQELRLREGLLVTRATVNVGGPVNITLEMALLRQDPHVALLRATVENGGNAPVRLSLAFDGLPGDARGVRIQRSLRALEPANLKPVQVARDSRDTAVYEAAPGATSRFIAVARVDLQKELPGDLGDLDAKGVEKRFALHRAAWAKLWQSDIEIDGDPEAQEVLRACRFYLLSSIRGDSDDGIPPMGLSAAAFSGHVFWDMDSWMLPALLPQHPEMARAMLEYRIRTLPGARVNAQAEKLPGASYAWESARSGKEALKGSVFIHGRHVTGDVALAMRQYFTATGDESWLEKRAWPVLQATADNWVARARPDGKGGLTIPNVTTPDENAGQVNGSAWTHHVARVNLGLAAETARTLMKGVNPRWETTAKGLGFRRDSTTNLILPYESFKDKTKAKQADVLLLLFPGEMDLPEAEQALMYDYYAPRVITTGPAMTDAVHAVVAARLGKMDEAERMFRESYRPFVRPPFHVFSEKRTRDNLCFLTGAAGVLEAAIYGFAGLHLKPDTSDPEVPRMEPHLPPSWNAMWLRNIQWRGAAWDVEIRPGVKPVWKRHQASE
jgi:trehalose/maltose hydrolase-like predicted phosphorylase